MLRSVIVEDEKHSRETLKNLLEEFCEGVEIIGEAASVDEAIHVIKKEQPALVFLDIELQTGTGFDVINAVSDMSFDVIFTTAFEQYAIKAIKFSSIDYLLKPIDIEDLQLAVEKAKERKDQKEYQQQLKVLIQNYHQPDNAHRNICLSTSDGIEFIKVDRILYCEANGSYTNFYLTDGQKLVVSKHLKEYENLLSDQQFMRVHNSFLINLFEVQKYVKSDGGYILMNNNATISIAQKKKDEFVERMALL